jgi:predicted transposase YbfD/YdcC
MTPSEPTTLIEHFAPLQAPRIVKKTRHILLDVVVMAICAVICGAEDWVSVAEFGRAKECWFRRFLELPHGIPSHDTFGRVFALISPGEFQTCFMSWMHALTGVFKGLVAIDGKTLRRSYDRQANRAAIHMVSAWASENGLVLGQLKTEEKSNEITAIPELLRVLAIKGCLVTIDAMGCQKAIAKQIVEQGGDYLLALKGNQSKLAEEVEAVFDQADSVNYEGYAVDFQKTEERNHGRQEIRRYWSMACEGLLVNAEPWEKLSMIGMVESERTVDGKTSIDYRYYIGSIDNDARLFAKGVRGHWGIENGLHWTLDVAFREDDCRVRKGHAPENFVLLRHIAVNAIKQERTAKLGVKNKRLKAGWDDSYLAKILLGI